MKKILLIMLLTAISSSFNLYTMQPDQSANSCWQSLPIELKSCILSLIPESKSMSEIVEKLKLVAQTNKESKSLVQSLIYDSESLINLAKIYVEENPKLAVKEFFDAVRDGKSELVKAFVAGGISVDIQNESGSTALISAARKGNLAIVQMLLNAGANIDSQDNSGRTALMFAARLGYKEIVELLIASGADGNIESNEGDTALNYAWHEFYLEQHNVNYQSILQLLIEKQDSSYFTNFRQSGNTILMYYAREDIRIDWLNFIFKLGFDPDLPDNHGNTLLLWAVENCKLDLVKVLLKWGADANIQDSNGDTILIKAVHGLYSFKFDVSLPKTIINYCEIIKMLLDVNADPSTSNNNGDSAASLFANYKDSHNTKHKFVSSLLKSNDMLSLFD